MLCWTKFHNRKINTCDNTKHYRSLWTKVIEMWKSPTSSAHNFLIKNPNDAKFKSILIFLEISTTFVLEVFPFEACIIKTEGLENWPKFKSFCLNDASSKWQNHQHESWRSFYGNQCGLKFCIIWNFYEKVMGTWSWTFSHFNDFGPKWPIMFCIITCVYFSIMKFCQHNNWSIHLKLPNAFGLTSKS